MATETVELAYEKRIYQQRRWGMDEGDRHFRHDSEVFRSLRKIAKKLEELGVAYAIAGGMALDAHGFRRLTVDVDILVTKESLRLIHERLEGLGYLPPFEKSKNLRDTETGVRIEFLIAGEYPGDGKPKPVAFPNPSDVAIEIDGARYLNLPTIVELKLASGMTGGVARMKDFTDVVALIQTLVLSADFVDQLNPYVHDKYLELWNGLKDSPSLPE